MLASPPKTRTAAHVIAAMSGGVDSSAAAALLVEQGYTVTGVTMRVASGEGRESSEKACCTLDAAEDARRVADRIGVPHYVLNYIRRFEEDVIEDFTQEYLAGRTPNPCSRCNQRVKFGALFEKAAAVQADCIATGHYVRKVERDGRFGLRRAAYRPKDQSYTLAGLGQAQLARALFPLGDLTKDETRRLARKWGLITAEKPESQEICFVPNDNYRDFLEARAGAARPGPIVTRAGEVLGEHHGLTHYTVGQRKGLGIAAPEPYYVLRIDPARNAIVVGHADETFSRGLSASEVVWGLMPPGSDSFRCHVQIRYRHQPVPAVCYPTGEDTFEAEFDYPERAVTPGQWAVLYGDDDAVLAAGLIDG